MNISEREVTIFLDSDGQRVMGLAAVDTQVPVYVQDTDDIGIWARIDRPDGKHVVLIRWDYVLSLDLRDREKEVGF